MRRNEEPVMVRRLTERMARGEEAPTTMVVRPSRRDEASGPRRVLMIARDYPPLNLPGPMRAGAFTKYLAMSGWQPFVVCQRFPGDPRNDPNLMPEVQR